MIFGEVKSPYECYILRDRENLGKFDPKSDEGIFLGYSTNSRAYRVFNKRIETDIDDEKVEAPSSGEGNQLNSAELLVTSADVDKTSPSMSRAKSLSTPITSDTIASASEDEDTPAKSS
jgi:hypothetical protein